MKLSFEKMLNFHFSNKMYEQSVTVEQAPNNFPISVDAAQATYPPAPQQPTQLRTNGASRHLQSLAS